MSTSRLLCFCRVAAASRRTLRNHRPRGVLSLARYQSTKQSTGGRKGFRLGRVAVYTLTTSGLVAGGALAYANYDPVFKNQVDEFVPGFSRWADTTADLLVERTGYPRPVPSSSRREESRWTSGGSGGGQNRPWDTGKRAEGRKTDTNTANQSSEPNPDHTHPDLTKKETSQRSVREDEKDVDVEKLGGGEVEVKGEEVGGVEEVVSSSQGERGAKEKMEVKGEDDKVGKEGEGEEVGEEEKEEVEKEGKVEVEKVLEEVRGEVEKVEKEVREERVREAQEVQMADQHLNWLRDSAQAEGKLDQTLEEFLSQTARVEEAQNSLLKTTQEHSRLVRDVTNSSVDEGLDSVYETADAVQRAEEAVQASREALKTAVEWHKNVALSLSQLMDQAVDLGLKSKVAEVEERVRECAGRLAEGSTAVQQAEVERELLQDYHRQAQKDREQLQRLL
ncbi:hypothetical protein GBAR_LOCUS20494 [Geodia barretti]|uniref:MICOS complex subunit MIC60 n=1 Tax=Geodia barretti TaxID=519541 RepID=A0AA35SWF1_GEOBA|nr:hypothetical protein GBAR_LOCUS20494 [Geodia barretti]